MNNPKEDSEEGLLMQILKNPRDWLDNTEEQQNE